MISACPSDMLGLDCCLDQNSAREAVVWDGSVRSSEFNYQVI